MTEPSELLSPLEPGQTLLTAEPIEVERPEIGKIVRRQTVTYRALDGTVVTRRTKISKTDVAEMLRFLQEHDPENYPRIEGEE